MQRFRLTIEVDAIFRWPNGEVRRLGPDFFAAWVKDKLEQYETIKVERKEVVELNKEQE